jgi:transposase
MDFEVVVTHGAGLDVHKKVIVATVLTSAVTETRSFGTLTPDLLALADWPQACGVTHVAMEATGVYWKPVVNLWEAYPFQAVLVVNPQHIQGMPGRKTDVQDSQWIAGLLRIGALKARDIPPPPAARAAGDRALPDQPPAIPGDGSQPYSEGVGRRQRQAELRD